MPVAFIQNTDCDLLKGRGRRHKADNSTPFHNTDLWYYSRRLYYSDSSTIENNVCSQAQDQTLRRFFKKRDQLYFRCSWSLSIKRFVTLQKNHIILLSLDLPKHTKITEVKFCSMHIHSNGTEILVPDFKIFQRMGKLCSFLISPYT